MRICLLLLPLIAARYHSSQLCGNGNYCELEQTCVTLPPNKIIKPGAKVGKRWGCSPLKEATICHDKRYSCPSGYSCFINGTDSHCFFGENSYGKLIINGTRISPFPRQDKVNTKTVEGKPNVPLIENVNSKDVTLKKSRKQPQKRAILKKKAPSLVKHLRAESSKQNMCLNDYTNFGSASCDAAWHDTKTTCAELEFDYNWDCSGCKCPGDKTRQNDCSSCLVDHTDFGSACCDSAWYETAATCAELEFDYNWDCSGCNCPGDGGAPAPVDDDGGVVVDDDGGVPPAWGGFCPIITSFLPSFCSCNEASTGLDIDCTIGLEAFGFVFGDIGVVAEIHPCAVSMYFSAKATALGFDYSIGQFQLPVQQRMPFPGLTYSVPLLADAGVDMVAQIDGNIETLTASAGVDMCYDAGWLGSACMGEIWLLQGNIGIAGACSKLRAANFKVEEAQRKRKKQLFLAHMQTHKPHAVPLLA